MRRVVWYMHNICAIHIRPNCVHGHPKVLVVYWLGLSIAGSFRVRLGIGNGYYISFSSPYLKVTNTFVFSSWPGAWYDSYLAAARVNQ